MKAAALESSGDGARWGWLALAVLVSVAGHGLLAYGVSKIPVSQRTPSAWIEMAMQIDEPPKPPPEPPKPPDPPKPEPPKPKEPVKYEKPPDVPPPPVNAPPPTAKPPRVVKGLTATSFAPGGNTGLQVSAGTTTATRNEGKMDLSEATETALVPYTQVSKPPKLRAGQLMEVPQDVIDAHVQGRVEVELTIDTAGNVTKVEVIKGLHPTADAACIAHCKKTKWTPYLQDGVATAVTGVPFSCRFEQVAN